MHLVCSSAPSIIVLVLNIAFTIQNRDEKNKDFLLSFTDFLKYQLQ